MKTNILFPLRKLHGTIHEYRLFCQKKRSLYRQYKHAFLSKKKTNDKTVFLILTPEHTNLGDHAIAFSEAELLRQHGFDYIEITGAKLLELQKYGLLGIMNGHSIIVNGGGNLGTLWYDVEELTRNVITSNPKSHIYILPNTIFYEDTEWGHAEFEASKRIYNHHKNLYLYARESISFEIMHKAYRNVKLVPDMVLRLNRVDPNTQRKGCLLCLRNDREKTLPDQCISQIKNILQPFFENDIVETDMHTPTDVSIAARNCSLDQKFQEFRNASLVITDRLHGMIFCAITATPCIVINSKSPKVKGCYQWLEHLEYIQFCSDVTKIPTIVSNITAAKLYYDSTPYTHYYNLLINDIEASF